MEIVANVQAIVFALGVKTTNVVKQLTEGDAVAVYEGERDHENDAQVMERYEKAVEACRVWLRAVVGVSVPMYINKYKVRATYLHALYAIVAEVSYYLSGFSKEINRDYLMNTKEISKFYINRDVDIIIKELLKAAGID